MRTLSLVAPVFNEVENLEPLHARVVEVYGDRRPWELVLVDDGSRDGSDALIRRLAAGDPRVVGVFFERNAGQTAALAAGFAAARGELIGTLDADLQNDPGDLPEMERLLEEGGYDAVAGYRARRNDSFVKRVSSRIGNGVRNWLTGDDIRDTGCGLKLFRADPLRGIPLFHGMHRFLPTLLRLHGCRVLQHPVSHHPRVAGETKYGIWNRMLPGLKDVLAVRWMRSRILKGKIKETTPRPTGWPTAPQETPRPPPGPPAQP